MKNLFDPQVQHEIHIRLRNLRPEARRKFGTMSAPQMMNHLNLSFDAYMGKLGMVYGGGNRLISKVVKFFTFTFIPIPRGRVRIPKEYESRDEYDFELERARFNELLNEYCDRPNTRAWPEHLFLGRLTPDEYGKLAYKHIDHHFRQFGV